MKTIFAACSAAAVLAAGVVGSADAQIVTFATFASSATANFKYANSSSTDASADGAFYSGTGSAASAQPITFSFINEGSSLDGAVTNVAATMTFTSSETSSPAITAGGQAIQGGLGGTFTIVSDEAITVGKTTYAAGSILLSAAFTNGGIDGGNKSSSGVFDANNENPGFSLSYSSDFLSFSPSAAEDASVSLTQITSVNKNKGASLGLTSAAFNTDSLRSFTAHAGGQFSADPVPTVNAVPEPASWALMLLGIGAAGGMMRRRAGLARTA
jgi:hypothetical protein